MKRNKHLWATVFAIAMTSLTITACGNEEGTTSSGSGTSTTAAPTQASDAAPTEVSVAEPTEEVTPTDVPEENPTPAEENNSGSMINGVDFTLFIKGGESEHELVERSSFNETRLFFFDKKQVEIDGSTTYRIADFEDGGYAILKSGETYHKKFEEHRFGCILKTNGQIDLALLNDGKMIYSKERMNEEDFELWANQFSMRELGYEGGTQEFFINITYDDGSSETFTFTVTDQ